MLSCKALAQQHASDYLDRQLTHRQRFGVRLHLMLCGNCRRFIAQFTLMRDVLRGSPPLTDETSARTTAEKLHKAYQEQKKY